MDVALYLLALIGAIGAFDTVYYHEWKARLPARGINVRTELLIHAGRDFLYVALFCTLPWMEWRGMWAAVLLGVFLAEILLTMWDFLIERRARREFGDVYPGERVTHNAMGIIYGGILAMLVPTLLGWLDSPTALVLNPAPVAEWLRWGLTLMGVGILVSGLRDLYAAIGFPHGGWPWQAASAKPTQADAEIVGAAR
jgi:hypothetical protein